MSWPASAGRHRRGGSQLHPGVSRPFVPTRRAERHCPCRVAATSSGRGRRQNHDVGPPRARRVLTTSCAARRSASRHVGPTRQGGVGRRLVGSQPRRSAPRTCARPDERHPWGPGRAAGHPRGARPQPSPSARSGHPRAGVPQPRADGADERVEAVEDVGDGGADTRARGLHGRHGQQPREPALTGARAGEQGGADRAGVGAQGGGVRPGERSSRTAPARRRPPGAAAPRRRRRAGGAPR